MAFSLVLGTSQVSSEETDVIQGKDLQRDTEEGGKNREADLPAW